MQFLISLYIKEQKGFINFYKSIIGRNTCTATIQPPLKHGNCLKAQNKTANSNSSFGELTGKEVSNSL